MTPVARTRRGEGAIPRHSPQKPSGLDRRIREERRPSFGGPKLGRESTNPSRAGFYMHVPGRGPIILMRTRFVGGSWLSPSTKRTRGTRLIELSE